jgi:hypothetical protein
MKAACRHYSLLQVVRVWRSGRQICMIHSASPLYYHRAATKHAAVHTREKEKLTELLSTLQKIRRHGNKRDHMQSITKTYAQPIPHTQTRARACSTRREDYIAVPPKEDSSKDCGKWRRVSPCGLSCLSSSGPYIPACTRAHLLLLSTSSTYTPG